MFILSYLLCAVLCCGVFAANHDFLEEESTFSVPVHQQGDFHHVYDGEVQESNGSLTLVHQNPSVDVEEGKKDIVAKCVKQKKVKKRLKKRHIYLALAFILTPTILAVLGVAGWAFTQLPSWVD